MPDDTSATSGQQAQQTSASVFVSSGIRQDFPELVELILKSESMNDEERQYWIDILPVMTPEQVEQLNTILKNEREQLAAIDDKYNKQIDAIAEQERPLKEITRERKERQVERSSKEEMARKEEELNAEDLLKRMEEM